MDGITYATHTHTVYLEAGPPPSFTQHVRHWAIASIDGVLPATDSEGDTTYLLTLPERIITVPLLHLSYSRLIMMGLLMYWMVAFRYRFHHARSGITQLKPYERGVFVLLMLCIGYLDQLKLCSAVIAAATALYGKPFDALALLAILLSAHEGWTITAISLTVGYLIWARESRIIISLRTYETFLAQLQLSLPAPQTSEEGEDRGCLVCWESRNPTF